jgi:hypothetical protein
VDDSVVYLAGIELDRPRESGSTRDGYFLGHQVVDCEPGKGFVCEEVPSAETTPKCGADYDECVCVGPQKALQGKIKRARGSRGEFWTCESCKHTNQCLAVSSYAEYVALSYSQAKDLVQCGAYNPVVHTVSWQSLSLPTVVVCVCSASSELQGCAHVVLSPRVLCWKWPSGNR